MWGKRQETLLSHSLKTNKQWEQKQLREISRNSQKFEKKFP